jgi:prepilin-type processing-associated H-X9-DG protein
VELLVVMGIIAVLAAIVFPALATARDSAKATTCLSNMRQIAAAYTAYSMDNQGYTPYQSVLPPGNYSYVNDFANPTVYRDGNPSDVSCLGLLIRYVGGTTAVYACPAATEVPWTQQQGPTAFSDTNYLANQVTLGRALSSIRNGSEVAFLQEDRYRWEAAWLRPYQLPDPGGIRQIAMQAGGSPATYVDWCDYNPPYGQEYSNLHRNGGNLAFVDGHVEWWAVSQMHPSVFGLVGIPGSSDSNDPNTVPQTQSYHAAF